MITSPHNINHHRPHHGYQSPYSVEPREGQEGTSPSGYTNLSTPNSSFYNLQMYSNPALPNFNLYQSVQEVPYHHQQPQVQVDRYDVNGIITNRHVTSPSPSQQVSSRQVHQNGITFSDPFAPSQGQTDYYSQNQTNSVSSSASRVIEPVVQPIFATFGTESIFVTCPYCHHTDSTEVEEVIGSEALFWACIIPFFGFLKRSKWDVRHRCNNCLNVIGIYYP